MSPRQLKLLSQASMDKDNSTAVAATAGGMIQVRPSHRCPHASKALLCSLGGATTAKSSSLAVSSTNPLTSPSCKLGLTHFFVHFPGAGDPPRLPAQAPGRPGGQEVSAAALLPLLPSSEHPGCSCRRRRLLDTRRHACAVLPPRPA